MRAMSPRITALAVALAVGFAAASPAGAALPGPPESEPRTGVIHSLNESPGCGGPDGVRGPYGTRAGALPPDELILGPWGDVFGRTIDQAHRSLVAMQLPMTGQPVTVWVHAAVAPALKAVIANLEREEAAGRTYTIRSWDTWSYNPITIPPGRAFSFHAVGAAIDINSTTNPYRGDNVLITDMPDWFVRAWTDAGWCWGGDWQTIKDPMHFSWQGPLFTSGQDTPAPVPPLTAPSQFGEAISFPTALGPASPAAVHLVADLDRDGAPDPVRLRPWTSAGHLGVEAASAQHEFETCFNHDLTIRPPAASGGYAMGDATGNGRPDLWAFDADGDRLVVEVYRWDAGYRARRILASGAATSANAVYLAGDHDRDGVDDLYVIRPGEPATVEVWRGPTYTSAIVTATAGIPIRPGDRVALGDRDVDGVLDLYVLGPGAGATLHIASGAAGFAALGTPIATAAGEHRGVPLQVGDLDGDGHDDLLFFDRDGTLVAYPGGITSHDPTTWFSEAHNRHWWFGEGCVPNPGFDGGGDGYLGARLATVAGVGSAFIYPNPATGVWTIADLAWRWWSALPAPAVDVEPIVDGSGPGYAVLLGGSRPAVEIRDAVTGSVRSVVRFGTLTDATDLVVVDDGEPAVAVLFGGDSPRVVLKRLDGTKVSVTRVGAIETIALEQVADTDGDGVGELAAVGTLPAGRAAIRVVSPYGGFVARNRVATNARFEIIDAAALPDALALVYRNGDRRGRVILLDDATAERVSVFLIDPIVEATAAAGPGGTLVIARRHARSGTTATAGWDPATGTRLWSERDGYGFDPAEIDHVEGMGLALVGHRLGDGNVTVTWRDSSSGRLLP